MVQIETRQAAAQVERLREERTSVVTSQMRQKIEAMTRTERAKSDPANSQVDGAAARGAGDNVEGPPRPVMKIGPAPPPAQAASVRLGSWMSQAVGLLGRDGDDAATDASEASSLPASAGSRASECEDRDARCVKWASLGKCKANSE